MPMEIENVNICLNYGQKKYINLKINNPSIHLVRNFLLSQKKKFLDFQIVASKISK